MRISKNNLLVFFISNLLYTPKIQREIFIYLKSYIKIMHDCIKSTEISISFFQTLYHLTFSKNTLQTGVK